MEVKIKLDEGATMPTYAKPGDAGMDLTATSVTFDKDGNYVYKTGVYVEIPDGYVGLLFPRSSISKTNFFLTNSVGVIDSGYRGEITFKFKSSIRYSTGAITLLAMLFGHRIFKNYRSNTVNVEGIDSSYKVGDRVGQLIIIPYPKIEFKVVDELSITERGCGGYGSTN